MKIKILLVDDQPDFLEPISFVLVAKGYEVLVANNGKQALELIKSEQPHIVFLDKQMPIMGGVETLRHLREFDKEMPVVMLTGFPDQESLSEARQLGISGFFPKRGDLQQLGNIIETILRTHKKLRPPAGEDKDK
ncbi:MAG: response regulator [Candidatus Omnitrophota bacterium]